MVPEPFLIAIATALAAAAVTTASASAAAGSAIRFRTSFVDRQCASIEFPAAEGFDGAIPFRIDSHLDEGKTLLLSCIAVRDDADAIDGSVFLKQGSNRVFGRVKTEISYKNILHDLLSEFGERRIGAGSDKAVGPDYRKMPKSTDV